MEMDKSLRVVELSARLPLFLQRVREFEALTGTEDEEFRRLYENSDRLWDDGFIRSASEQGIGRWEEMLRLRPGPGDSLEERRAAVLSRWNQQLPYTVKRLEETLASLVGASGFRLDTGGFPEYKLKLSLINQSDRTARSVKELLDRWLPANMVLLLVSLAVTRSEARVYAGAVRRDFVRLKAGPKGSGEAIRAEVPLKAGAAAFAYVQAGYGPDESREGVESRSGEGTGRTPVKNNK